MADSEVLFTITKDNLETGLRGVPVGYCTTSNVDPLLGLFYSGYPIDKLAYNQPEEVIYLLFNGEMPNPEQLADFKKQLIAHSKLHPGVIANLKTLPKEGHPMKWFLHGLNLMGMYSGEDDYVKDGMNVVAQLPELVAAIYRIRSGWGDTIASNPELGYIENFVAMLNPPNATKDLLLLMKVFNVLHYDHSGGNLSTFVGKAVASGLEDMYGSLMGAMAALAGPLHGMANQECLRFLKTALETVNDPTNDDEVNKYIDDLFAQGKKLFGFGHAVLRVEDPRATVQYDLGEKIAPDNKIFRMAVAMRKLGTEFLKKQPKVSSPYPNVDAVSGSLLTSVGLTDENYYTVLFGMSRCVGIAAQIIYERRDARGGKGTPIIRPKYLYSGPKR
ncbi:MAG: citrate (Si)-synthase [Candidatus Sericytochromatia bacterium]|nr:citrate (Si)-synthase [Candidatus Sericytochromatia bacterium]